MKERERETAWDRERQRQTDREAERQRDEDRQTDRANIWLVWDRATVARQHYSSWEVSLSACALTLSHCSLSWLKYIAWSLQIPTDTNLTGRTTNFKMFIWLELLIQNRGTHLSVYETRKKMFTSQSKFNVHILLWKTQVTNTAALVTLCSHYFSTKARIRPLNNNDCRQHHSNFSRSVA